MRLTWSFQSSRIYNRFFKLFQYNYHTYIVAWLEKFRILVSFIYLHLRGWGWVIINMKAIRIYMYWICFSHENSVEGFPRFCREQNSFFILRRVINRHKSPNVYLLCEPDYWFWSEKNKFWKFRNRMFFALTFSKILSSIYVVICLQLTSCNVGTGYYIIKEMCSMFLLHRHSYYR